MRNTSFSIKVVVVVVVVVGLIMTLYHIVEESIKNVSTNFL